MLEEALWWEDWVNLEDMAIGTTPNVISSEKQSPGQLFVATSCLPKLVLYAFVIVVIVLGWYSIYEYRTFKVFFSLEVMKTTVGTARGKGTVVSLLGWEEKGIEDLKRWK